MLLVHFLQDSKRSHMDVAGKNDSNTTVILPQMALETGITGEAPREMTRGDYVAVKVSLI